MAQYGIFKVILVERTEFFKQPPAYVARRHCMVPYPRQVKSRLEVEEQDVGDVGLPRDAHVKVIPQHDQETPEPD